MKDGFAFTLGLRFRFRYRFELFNENHHLHPDSSLPNPLVMLRAMLADLWAGRELAWRLTVQHQRGNTVNRFSASFGR